MIGKILSKGQTGVELAALDLAIKLGLAHGGWTPRGRRNQEGPLPKIYRLQETVSVGFQQAMERNVMDSDGTLLISRGQKSPEIRYAVQMALKHQQQLLHIDLRQHTLFDAASLVNSWSDLQHIKVVHVTGPTARDDHNIYRQSQKILETAFYLGFVKSGLHPRKGDVHLQVSPEGQREYPKTVEEAVERLKAALPLKDRTLMANMQNDELEHLHSGLSEYIKQNFGLYAGNIPLLQSCAKMGQLVHPLPDEACRVILRMLWEDLHKTHRLRIIK